MTALARSRIGLAAAVGAVAIASAAVVLAVSSTRVAAGTAQLEPDLVTMPIHQDDLALEHDGSTLLLRLTNEIGNRGNGPLEVFPGPQSLDCDRDGDASNDRDASQRVFTDDNADGVFERGVDGVAYERLFGCMRFHAAHHHWHVLDFAGYELRREPTGVRVAHTRKVGFCLTDARAAFPGPVVQATSTYPINLPGAVGCGSSSIQGISPGWADAYALTLPGQTLDVTGLPRGQYCLTTRADPTGLLDELDETNNVRRVRVLLRPGRMQARRLDGACRS